MAVRIVIVDDHRIVREGLRSLLADQPDLEVVGEAENGLAAVRLATKLKPDIVVMDVTMPGLNGMEATRRLLNWAPDTRVVALSMHADRRFVAGMLDAGALGYLLKDAAFEELATAVRAVAANRPYLSSGISGVLLEDFRSRRHGGDATPERLSPREREVLQLIAEGHSTKQIASLLCLSVKTVETHRRNIQDRLGMRSIAELTKYAVREGLTTLDE